MSFVIGIEDHGSSRRSVGIGFSKFIVLNLRHATMPSTKVNVAEVLDEIQLADLNPDTRDATIQKSLETLRDIFISRAVLDVSKIGVDIRVVW